MDNNINWKSRKFWISIAAMLASIGSSIAGLTLQNTTVVAVGIICTVLAGGIYSFCNAYQTGKIISATQTVNNNNNTTTEVTNIKETTDTDTTEPQK